MLIYCLQNEVRNVHKPLFLDNSADKGIVVFVHGFMGSPRQFDKMAENVHCQGYSVASILLPGHGATTKEFSSCTMESWLNHVYTEVERYSRSYDNIYLVGHSMGCLLAINTAIKYSERVRGVLLIACPFKLKGFSVHSLKVRIKQAFYRKSHPIKAAYLAGSSVPLSPSLIWHSAKPAAELKKLILITKDNLPDIHVPVTAIYSSADELVSIDSLDILRTGLKQTAIKYIALSDSLHAYYPEHEQAVIESTLLHCMGVEASKQTGEKDSGK